MYTGRSNGQFPFGRLQIASILEALGYELGNLQESFMIQKRPIKEEIVLGGTLSRKEGKENRSNSWRPNLHLSSVEEKGKGGEREERTLPTWSQRDSPTRWGYLLTKEDGLHYNCKSVTSRFSFIQLATRFQRQTVRAAAELNRKQYGQCLQ